MAESETALAVVQPTPMEIIAAAIQKNAGVEELGKLMDMQQRWEANEARKAYDAAFAAFKAEAVVIVKNITVADGPLKGKKYADLFAVVEALTPALSRHGLGASWKLTKDDKDWLEVTCTLRHERGHYDTASMGGPPDIGGAKNAIQARGSTKSYLERYTLLAVTGMAASGQDNDGNNIPTGDLAEQIEWLQNAKDLSELQKLYTQAFKKFAGDKRAQHAIITAKDKRKGELEG